MTYFLKTLLEEFPLSEAPFNPKGPVEFAKNKEIVKLERKILDSRYNKLLEFSAGISAWESKSTPGTILIVDTRGDTPLAVGEFLFGNLSRKFSAQLDSFAEIKDTIVEKHIWLDEKFRNHGIATRLYAFLAENKKVAVVSDLIHYDGARKLWERLSSLSNKFEVLFFDTITETIGTNKDGSLIHFSVGNPADKELWFREGQAHKNAGSYIVLIFRTKR